MRFRPLVVGVSCAVVLLVAGCSSEEAGSPVSPGGPVSTTSSAVTGVPSGSVGDDGVSTPLAGTDPCSLLTEQEVAKFGEFKPPERKPIGTADTCSWEPVHGSSLSDDFSLLTVVRTNAGVDDAKNNGQGVHKTEAGGRQWAQIPVAGGCTVVIGVTSGSRVDVLASGLEAKRSCALADEVAQLVEPKLPKG